MARRWQRGARATLWELRAVTAEVQVGTKWATALMHPLWRMCVCGSGESAVEEALRQADKHASHSEKLAALVAEARGMLEHAKAEQEERARAAAEAAEAEAAELRQVEEAMTALAARKAKLVGNRTSGVPSSQEELCTICLDAPKDHILVPCGYQCVCGACASMLRDTETPVCPICRTGIRETLKVFR